MSPSVLDKKSYARILAILAAKKNKGELIIREDSEGLTVNEIITEAKNRYNKKCSKEIAQKILVSLRALRLILNLDTRWYCKPEGRNEYNTIKNSRPHLLEPTMSPESYMNA